MSDGPWEWLPDSSEVAEGLPFAEVDDDALREAASILGTRTKKDTVNAALREVAKRRRRLAALDELAVMGERGDFDELLDKRAYRR